MERKSTLSENVSIKRQDKKHAFASLQTLYSTWSLWAKDYNKMSSLTGLVECVLTNKQKDKKYIK